MYNYANFVLRQAGDEFEDFEWFVKDGTPFEEGIVVDRGGALLSLTPQSLECASFILPPLTPLVIGT